MTAAKAYGDLKAEICIPARVLDGTGRWQKIQLAVAEEHSLEIFLDGVSVCSLACTPTYLEELALGRLFSERLLWSVGDVEEIVTDRLGRSVRLTLRQDIRKLSVSSNPVAAPLLPVRPIPWKTEWVKALGHKMQSDTLLYQKTRSVHSCFLAREGEILFSAEDISRHNALDKVIGWALRQKIPLFSCMLYTSGRVPADMADKVIRAGVPVLISKAPPTAQALALAEKYRLTLIGMKKDGTILCYYQPQEADNGM